MLLAYFLSMHVCLYIKMCLYVKQSVFHVWRNSIIYALYCAIYSTSETQDIQQRDTTLTKSHFATLHRASASRGKTLWSGAAESNMMLLHVHIFIYIYN